MDFDLIEQPRQRRWLLPLGGELILRCCLDYAITFDTRNDVSLRIEGSFVFTSAGGAEHLIASEADPVTFAPGGRRSSVASGMPG